ECKRPSLPDALDEAISQSVRNQRDDGIPRLFSSAQLLMAITKNEAKYATVGTSAKFWSEWKEDVEAQVEPLLSTLLPPEAKAKMLALRTPAQRALFDELEKGRAVTSQD